MSSVVLIYNDGNSGDGSIPIIVESVGGAIVSFIIPLSFVILYTRQSYKKRSCDFDNRIMIEDPDVKIDPNPSYDINKPDIKMNIIHLITLINKVRCKKINMIMCCMINNSFTMMMQKILLRWILIHHMQVYKMVIDVYVVTEPEYDSTIQLKCSKATKISEDEDQDGYVEINSKSTQRAGYLKIIGSTN